MGIRLLLFGQQLFNRRIWRCGFPVESAPARSRDSDALSIRFTRLTGEDNRDGANDNRSWNCGVEGPTNDPGIERLLQSAGEELPHVTLGTPHYTRIDAPATPEQKVKLQKLSPEAIKESELAGEAITAKLIAAPGNNAPIGGLKVVATTGWFAARPSGTENIYKIYAESFKGQAHLNAILNEAHEMVNSALES